MRPAAGSGGLRGDVYYFAPCGKKIRTYPDVKKVSLTRDSGIVRMHNTTNMLHFSSDQKVINNP